MQLLPKQEHAVYYLKDRTTTDLIYGGAAGGGKSALGCLWLIEGAQQHKGSRAMMGRSKLKTLKETTLNTFFELASTLKISNQFKYNDQSSTINWNNGSQILLKDLFLYPSDKNFDSLGSLEITRSFIDECNQVVQKAWQVSKSRIRYKLDEFDVGVKQLGTCNPSKEWVYKEFYLKDRNNELESYKKFIQALPTDNKHLPKSYLESLLQLDQNSRERLYYGNWEYDDDPSALIDYEKIINIFSNSFVEGGNKYITADIARFGKDTTVVGVWDGFRLVKIFVLVKASITEVSAFIKKTADEYKIPMSDVIVDEDGVGGGVVDILKCQGFVNNSRPLPNPLTGKIDNYENLKTQCYYAMAKRVNENGLFVVPTGNPSDIEDKMAEELEQVKRFDMDKDGKMKIIRKEMVKKVLGRSPDFSDMMAMREWFELRVTREAAFGW